MIKHSFLSLFAALACLFACIGLPSQNAQAAGFDPYFINMPPDFAFTPTNLLDPTSGKALQLAWLSNIDPANFARLARTYAVCTNPGSPALFGLTVGLLYCMKLHISDATHIFAAGVSNPNNVNFPGTIIPINFFVKLYQGSCFLLAFALFGVRLMTLQSENLGKDVMSFMVKFAVALFLITQSAYLFDMMAAALGQGIGWLTAATTVLPDDPKSCLSLIYAKAALTTVATNVPPNDPNFNYGEYEAWHKIDCLFVRIFGAGPPTGGIISFAGFNLNIPDVGQKHLIYGSLIPIIGLLMFTSTIALSTALMGLTLLVMFIKLVLKALFLILSAYLAMALFALLTPFMAPLIVFESHRNDSYVMKIFERWMGILWASLIQPIIVVAYLGFCALLLNTFIQGDISEDPAIAALFNNCKPDQVGEGICSVNQLAAPFPNWTTPDGSLPLPVGNFNHMTEINPVLLYTKILGDPQTVSNNCSIVDRTRTYLPQTNIDVLNQVDSKGSGISLPGPNRMKMYLPRMMKLALTFACFVILAVVLYHMMDRIVQLASTLTGSAIINLWQGLTVPFAGFIDDALNGAKKGLAGQGKNIDLAASPRLNAARGALEGMRNFLTGNRS